MQATLTSGRHPKTWLVIGRATKWAAALLIAALLGAIINSHFSRRDSYELTLRQQELASLQKFESSGAALDQSFRAFNDAIVDQKNVYAAKQGFRDAIAKNSSDAFAVQDLLGAHQSKEYIANLAGLRAYVDQTSNSVNAIPMAQAALNLISERRSLVVSTQKKINEQAGVRE